MLNAACMIDVFVALKLADMDHSDPPVNVRRRISTVRLFSYKAFFIGETGEQVARVEHALLTVHTPTSIQPAKLPQPFSKPFRAFKSLSAPKPYPATTLSGLLQLPFYWLS